MILLPIYWLQTRLCTAVCRIQGSSRALGAEDKLRILRLCDPRLVCLHCFVSNAHANHSTITINLMQCKYPRMTDTKINTSKRQKLDPADPPEDWRVTAARAQQRVVDSIPKQWIMPPSTKAKHTGDARSFALDCGILTPRQISITSLDATALLHQIHTGELTAAEATEAFCARAAIAHQLVNCLTEFMPEAAIAEARLLDEEFSRTGEVRGPLHGLPMAVKDIMHVRGSRVTMAWVAWAEREVSGFDASPVRVMREAGAVVFGRTAMPQTGE